MLNSTLKTLLFIGLASTSLLAQTKKYNVLFIMVDDLRSPLEKDQMLTPNIDRLANQGVRFKRQYTQTATCGASRYGLLTGRRTNTTDNNVIGRKMKNLPSPESFPHLFKQSGYKTIGIGKIGHTPDGLNYKYNGTGAGDLEMPRSWDQIGLTYGSWTYGWGSFFAYAGGKSREGSNKADPTYVAEWADVPDTGYPDGLIAKDAVQKLKELKDSTFFLAVGFFKPHLPFNAPKKYWDLYDRDSLNLTPYGTMPNNTNATQSGEIKRYDSYGLTGEALERLRLHGYYACASYVDAQIGKVLNALDSLGLRENTIVALWGDHGWHLGENTFWGKHTSLEWGVHSPLIISAPNHKKGVANGVVEAIDIYPTLAELAGLTPPATVDGSSFAHLLRSPNAPGKSAAFSYWNNTSMRTDRYRLIVGPKVELYDYQTDPGGENNIAAQNKAIVDSLTLILNKENPSYPVIAGCPDSTYQEYTEIRTKDDQALCKVPVSIKTKLTNKEFIINQKSNQWLINLPHKSDYTITVTDIAGKNIYSQNHKNTQSISLNSPSSAGVYLLNVQSKEINISQKVIQ